MNLISNSLRCRLIKKLREFQPLVSVASQIMWRTAKKHVDHKVPLESIRKKTGNDRFQFTAVHTHVRSVVMSPVEERLYHHVLDRCKERVSFTPLRSEFFHELSETL